VDLAQDEDSVPPFPYRTTVYVHGAGEQEHPLLLKRRLDGVVFGEAQGDRTIVGYFSHVLYGPPSLPPGLESTHRDPIEVAADPTASREQVVAALAGEDYGSLESTSRKADLARAFVERADEVAATEIARTGGAEGIRFPDWGFRIVVGIVAKDVIKYLFDGYGDACRDEIRTAIQSAADPTLVIAHSLGAIVVFDVLSEREFSGREIHLVTLGCPLGIENVQDELRGPGDQPHPIPDPVRSWSNLADDGDPVAVRQILAPEFTQNAFEFDIVDDLTVNNRGFLNHELTGYLVIDEVRRAIRVG
jgi:hypothetical protein